ncbi:MAG: replication/maintenance protein RepL [Candidatus Borkfalkia sp.]
MFWLLCVSARNKVMMKAEEIAKKFDTTRPRIDRMKRRLKEQGFIKYIPNVIFINPDFYWRGSASMRESAAEEYLNF